MTLIKPQHLKITIMKITQARRLYSRLELMVSFFLRDVSYYPVFKYKIFFTCPFAKKIILTQFNFTFFYYPTRQSSVQYSWTYVISYWISLSHLSRVNAFFYFESHYLNLNVFSAILPNNSLENLFRWSIALDFEIHSPNSVYKTYFLLFYCKKLFL